MSKATSPTTKLRVHLHVTDSKWNRNIVGTNRLLISTGLLGTIPFGTGSKWIWIGRERKKKLEVRSSKTSDWHTSSALLLFSCSPARQLTPAQLSCITSKSNRSRGKAVQKSI